VQRDNDDDLSRQESDATTQSETTDAVYDGLINSTELSLGLRIGMVFFLAAAVFLFLSAESFRGVYVLLDVRSNEDQVFQLPYVVEMSILALLDGMTAGRNYGIVVFLSIFCGVWPYAKVFILMYCWTAPTFFLPVHRRQQILDFLDAFGKWSMVDIYMFIIPMMICPFHANISSFGPVRPVFEEIDSDLVFNLWVDVTGAFHEYFAATLISLIAGLSISAANRKVLKIGEYAPERKHTVAIASGRRRLCNYTRPDDWVAGKLYAHSSTTLVALSLGLVIIGIFIPMQKYAIGGLAGMFGSAVVHEWTLWQFIGGIAAASSDGLTIGVVWTQIVFVFFTMLTVVVYMPTVLILWTCPLTRNEQRRTLVACQILNSMATLDVFMVTMAFVRLAVNSVANYFAMDFCDALANTLEFIFPELQCHDVFDVTAECLPGFWILLIGAIMYSATGQYTLTRCVKAIMAPPRRVRKREHSGGMFLRWLTKPELVSGSVRASVGSRDTV